VLSGEFVFKTLLNSYYSLILIFKLLGPFARTLHATSDEIQAINIQSQNETDEHIP
jgi:hypothetical protein